MSFEYGSESLEIKNPFKVEGTLYLIRGLIVAVLGGILIFSVKEIAVSGAKTHAWACMIIGVILLLSGITGIGSGLFKMFRFFVGRGVPASLSKNMTRSESHTEEKYLAYASKTLEQMLMGRKNSTFKEPKGWINRMIYTLFLRLVYMPYLIRNVTQRIITGFISTLSAFAVYGLALFSSEAGLTNIRETPVADWLALGLAAAILIIWLKRYTLFKKELLIQTEPSSALGLTLIIAAAILMPFGLASLHEVRPLPEVPVIPVRWILFIGGFALLTSAIGIGLAILRASAACPSTNVSEFKDQWQENLHPMDIFRAFDMIMADYRHREIPNRIYREFDPKLMLQGSQDKGDFNGDTMVETQPVSVKIKTSGMFHFVRFLGTIIAQALFVLSALCLFKAADNLPQADPNALIETLLPPFVFLLFSKIIGNTVHLYWAEMHFKSYLVHFFSEGTYSESKLSTGMSIYDSTRSENVVVRSSMSPWLLVSEIITGTFAFSGANNLILPRIVLEMHKANETLDTILSKLRDFIEGRQVIAGVSSEKDYEAAGNMYRMNVVTRPKEIAGEEYPSELPHHPDNKRLTYNGETSNADEDAPPELPRRSRDNGLGDGGNNNSGKGGDM